MLQWRNICEVVMTLDARGTAESVEEVKSSAPRTTQRIRPNEKTKPPKTLVAPYDTPPIIAVIQNANAILIHTPATILSVIIFAKGLVAFSVAIFSAIWLICKGELGCMGNVPFEFSALLKPSHIKMIRNSNIDLDHVLTKYVVVNIVS